MAIQQRAYVLTQLAADLNGNSLIFPLLARRRHRWRKWHAWILHEAFIKPSTTVLNGAGHHSFNIYAVMRDADMWGAQYTARYWDPNLSPVAAPGFPPEGISVPGLLAHDAIDAAGAGGPWIFRWTSLPRLVAADAIQVQYGTDGNLVFNAQMILRYENVTLPGWQAWEEAVMETMGRQRTAINP